MRSVFATVTLVFLLYSSLAFQRTSLLNQIVPLHSKRSEIERLLGKSTDPCRCVYHTEEGTIYIDYAKSECRGNLPGWNVPADTVLTAVLYPRLAARLSDLNIDRRSYEISEDDSSTRYFTSQEKGIEYEVAVDDTIKAISRFPSTENGHQRCVGFPSSGYAPTHYTAFDRLVELEAAEQRARLDAFAFELLQNPEMKGYVIAYAGPSGHESEAKEQAETARKYLIGVRGIKPPQVQAFDGGNRERRQIELYVLADGAPPPRPRPTVARPRQSGNSIGTDKPTRQPARSSRTKPKMSKPRS